MIVDTHTDTEQMRDGTRRWLWQVRHGDRLWSAGVVSSLLVAESEATRALRALHASLAPPVVDGSAAEAEQEQNGPASSGGSTVPEKQG